jgi:hypothetical protein
MHRFFTLNIAKTHIILAQNSRENYADFVYIRCFFILISLFLTRKLAETYDFSA